jgi:hypothetical protein
MARLLLLLVIWIMNQMPFVYQIRVDSDCFLGAFSFQVNEDQREAVGVWENGPGFRNPEAVDAANDGSTLVSQDHVRSFTRDNGVCTTTSMCATFHMPCSLEWGIQ